MLTTSLSTLPPGAPVEALPLTFPAEVWASMGEEQRAAAEQAQALLDGFGNERTLGLREMRRRAGLEMDAALRGLDVLDDMGLVQIEPTEGGPSITLMARPEVHVRIHGIDGQVRWVFVARPLDAPEVDPLDLN